LRSLPKRVVVSFFQEKRQNINLIEGLPILDIGLFDKKRVGFF